MNDSGILYIVIKTRINGNDTLMYSLYVHL